MFWTFLHFMNEFATYCQKNKQKVTGNNWKNVCNINYDGEYWHGLAKNDIMTACLVISQN